LDIYKKEFLINTRVNTNLKKLENKESIYFKGGKRDIIETKGEQNGKARDVVRLPESSKRRKITDAVLKEREGQVGKEGQIYGENEKARLTPDDQGGLRERQGNLSDIHKERERQVGIERQIFSKADYVPIRFKKACNKDGHVPNKIGKSLSQGKNLFIFDTATVIKFNIRSLSGNFTKLHILPSNTREGIELNLSLWTL
jgi:hypothetical protein